VEWNTEGVKETLIPSFPVPQDQKLLVLGMMEKI
jgi:hypothetical protein